MAAEQAALWIAYFIRKMFIMKRWKRNQSYNVMIKGTLPTV